MKLMQAINWFVCLLGGSLTIARLAHAYGVITKYSPSISRAIGFSWPGLFTSLAAWLASTMVFEDSVDVSCSTHLSQ